jgi:hypothetical protein
VIKEAVNSKNVPVYYYSCGNLNQKFKDSEKDNSRYLSYIRLFSTDIILLGSLVEDDLHGIPKMDATFPASSASYPTITPTYQAKPVTLMVSDNDETDTSEATQDHSEAYLGQTVIFKDQGRDAQLVESGLNYYNWNKGRLPVEAIKYERGLLVDLTCSSYASLPKTCINVKRMSELGVSLDDAKEMPGAKSKKLGDPYTQQATQMINYTRADGCITDMEINNHETRATFAMMNSGKLVAVAGTPLSHYEFKYMYPTRFDGTLTDSLNKYMDSMVSGKAGNQYLRCQHFDYKDDDYIDFRFGSYRHFYYTNGVKSYMFPLYENSFYFYFGIRDGYTAIDEFYKNFYSECTTNDEIELLTDSESLGNEDSSTPDNLAKISEP